MDLSIIIPAYNVEKWIDKCLHSVCELQGLVYEIIVVNDGSTDGTLHKIEEFRKIYKEKVIIIEQKNKGQSAARNQGLKVAKGEYICFLDSDDYVDGNKLVQFFESAKKDEVDIAFGDYCYDIEGNYKQNPNSVRRKKISVRHNNICDGITYAERMFNRKSNYINSEVCFALFNREFLEDNKLYFKEGIYHEDTLFFYNSIVLAKKVKYYDIVFYYYRIRTNSTMTSISKEMLQKRADAKFYIAKELYNLKCKYFVEKYFIDSYIIDLMYYVVITGRIECLIDWNMLKSCKKRTNKSVIKYFILKGYCIKNGGNKG